jgi:uncharacterized protein YdeI (YjbR/CyaY-like superfamily)
MGEGVVRAPADLAVALKEHPRAKAFWGGLPPEGRAAYIAWIEEANHAEERSRRIDETIHLLIEGKPRRR